MANPSNPQYVTANQESVVPGDTSTHALFSTPTAAISALIVPLSANVGATPPLVDYAATPVNQGGITLPVLPNGRYYYLAKLNITCSDAADGVLVIWFT